MFSPILNKSKKPKFKNGCKHKGYIGSFSFFAEGKKQWYDIYIYKGLDKEDKEQHICIRNGELDHEYYSPLNIIVLLSSPFDPYQITVEYLKTQGQFIFRKN